MARLARERLKQQVSKRGAVTRFAAELGISRSYLSYILSGDRRPSLVLAAKLEAVTGIPAREFVKVD